MSAAASQGTNFLGAPWLIAYAAVLAAVIRDQLKALLTWIIQSAAKGFYARFAGSPLLRRAALKRYTTAVYDKYEYFLVPFVDNLRLPMREVYVPLEAERPGTWDGVARDAYTELRAARRAVVIGVPGAGKSMLLRQTMFAWAAGRRNAAGRRPRMRIARGGEIPVLVELHRMNEAGTGIVAELVAQLRRNGFPRAERFVASALESGRLTVLLDGLDEVASSRRSAVVQQILNFAEEYRECRLVVTCREAVYQGQLAEQVSATLRVADLDERLIRQFLYGWPSLRQGGALDQLMSALDETPQLKQLAGNPLLLTMIAYLYTSASSRADRTLPHSRAEFYKRVIDGLLDQRWHLDQVSFPGPSKKAVLVRLARVAHEQFGGSRDRVALPAAVVAREISAQLPDFNIDPARADDLLREIVDRSGLLLKIDGGESYQFAHQTLQEYLAALSLHTDMRTLLELHAKDPLLWREVLRLWCGSTSQDSTDVIENVFATDPLLAFECLADAQNVRSDVADRIIEHFQDRLDDSPPITASFGLVASDKRPRGRRVFEYLAETLHSDNPARVRGAAFALAATHLPEAVTVLLPMADRLGIDQCLVSMGDIAVSALRGAPPAPAGDVTTPTILGRIATPAAMAALVPFLVEDSIQAVVAARYLAAGLADHQVELALAAVKPSPQLRAGARLAWVWAPFSKGPDDPVAIIAGRVAKILADADSALMTGIEAGWADPRIVIPLCTVQQAEWKAPIDFTVTPELGALLHGLSQEELAGLPKTVLVGARLPVTVLGSKLWQIGEQPADADSTAHDAFSSAVLEALNFPRQRAALLGMLAPDLRSRLINQIFSGSLNNVRVKHWENVLRIPDYEFVKGWHFRAVTVLAIAAWLLALEGVLSAAFGWHRWGSAEWDWAAVAVLTIGSLISIAEWLDDKAAIRFALAVIYVSPFAATHIFREAWRQVKRTGSKGWIPDMFLAAAIFPASPLALLYMFSVLESLGRVTAVAIMAGLAVLAGTLLFAGWWKDRAARNPLHGLLPQ